MARPLWLMALFFLLVACGPAEDSVYDPCTDETIINFPDPHLNANIRSQLAISDEEPIQVKHVCHYWYIECISCGITDLTGLEKMPWLTELQLSGNNISSLEPLRGLTSLEKLDVGGSSITEVAPLSGLTNLVELDISANTIENIDSLVNLSAIEHLAIGMNKISNISSLTSIKNMRILSMGKNNIIDISYIKSMSELIGLFVEDNCIADFSAIDYLRQNGKLTNVSGDSAEEQDYARCQ